MIEAETEKENFSNPIVSALKVQGLTFRVVTLSWTTRSLVRTCNIV